MGSEGSKGSIGSKGKVRRFHIFMRRTTISHFAFLIFHSIEVFKRNQGASRPTG